MKTEHVFDVEQQRSALHNHENVASRSGGGQVMVGCAKPPCRSEAGVTDVTAAIELHVNCM